MEENDLTSFDLEEFWENLLSERPAQIQAAFERLNSQERQAVLVHLKRMASEKGWHPQQRRSAQRALAVLTDRPLASEGGVNKAEGREWTLAELTAAMHEFVRAQGWYDPDSPRPQTLRNLAISLNLEASEVLEHFQWSERLPERAALAEELADVALYLLQLASLAEIDLQEAILTKLKKNYRRTWEE